MSSTKILVELQEQSEEKDFALIQRMTQTDALDSIVTMIEKVTGLTAFDWMISNDTLDTMIELFQNKEPE